MPPVVLLPTPPTTTAPKAKHSLVELQTLLQLPPPMKPAIACERFFSPPPIVDERPLAILHIPPLIVD